VSEPLPLDDQIELALRRRREMKRAIERVRSAASKLNNAAERAAALGLDVELAVIPRRDDGAKFAKIVPSIFVRSAR